MTPATYDYVIIGSGIAGLYTALLAQEHGRVLIVTKGGLEEANTRYAQGGIAAAIGADDSPALHTQDTLVAGAGLCDPAAVDLLTHEAPDRITDLIRFGVPFDTNDGEVALTREAAHSVNRILHAGGDATGEHIELTLGGLARLRNIVILEHAQVTRILVGPHGAYGIEALDTRSLGLAQFEGRHIILATGGAGRLFRHTTNPEVATGDGVALGFRAGAAIADMEFFQFHPTSLRLPGVAAFLITEAMRGEGGLLTNVQGQRFMPAYHRDAELAPRDIVARAVFDQMRLTGSDHVFLDATHRPAPVLQARFPQIYKFCLEHGLDLTREPIPVAPAAHYMMGGVRTNLWGETTVPHLYACGECACTGVHGANRLASNSLMEVLVFGKRILQRTLQAGLDAAPVSVLKPNDEVCRLPASTGGGPAPAPTLAAVQDLLWSQVGIVRSGESLQVATRQLAAWQRDFTPALERPALELANMVLLGRLMSEAALLRQESRGAHYRTDFPEPSDAWLRHLVYVAG